MLINHIAIIASNERSLSFYERLGFNVVSREKRPTDELVYMCGNGIVLEFYIDDTHPPRVDRPEAMGLRHLAFTADDFDSTVAKLEWANPEPVRGEKGSRFTFIKDPDGIPIEIRE